MPLSSSSYQQLSDADLLQRYRQTQDLADLAALFGRYTELTYGSCLKYLKDRTGAEDAVMNIFEELTQKVNKHEIKQFRGWLHVLTRNHCLMLLRKQSKNKTVEFDPQLMQSAGVVHPEYDLDEPTGPGQTALLKNCLEGLAQHQRYAVEQFYYGDKSYKDIAAEMGDAVGKVRSNIQNGRRNLRICMERNAQ
ncbi:MAG: sigma-70 family RNA polymerase sigma factor [Bacteroidota bacterium]